jgi:TonB family protein
MNQVCSTTHPYGLRKAGMLLFQAAALGLLLAIALPARAGDDRAIKTRVAPVYPEIAKRMKIAGMVRIEATVDPQGKVKEVKTVSGNHMLSVAAEDAVRQWKFAPAPEDSTVNVDVNFAAAQ